MVMGAPIGTFRDVQEASSVGSALLERQLRATQETDTCIAGLVRPTGETSWSCAYTDAAGAVGQPGLEAHTRKDYANKGWHGR
jgi:hypothetical protein